MPCTQTLSGISRDCNRNSGGVRRVWLFNAADIDTFQWDVSDPDAPHGVDIVYLKTGKASVEFEFRPGAASLTSTETVSAENGSRYVQNELTMTFHRMDSAKRAALVKLQFAELAAVVLDNNGREWYLGPTDKPAIGYSAIEGDEPLMQTGGDGLTGTDWGDRNGYSIVLSSRSKDKPWPYLSAQVPAPNPNP